MNACPRCVDRRNLRFGTATDSVWLFTVEKLRDALSLPHKL